MMALTRRRVWYRRSRRSRFLTSGPDFLKKNHRPGSGWIFRIYPAGAPKRPCLPRIRPPDDASVPRFGTAIHESLPLVHVHALMGSALLPRAAVLGIFLFLRNFCNGRRGTRRAFQRPRQGQPRLLLPRGLHQKVDGTRQANSQRRYPLRAPLQFGGCVQDALSFAPSHDQGTC